MLKKLVLLLSVVFLSSTLSAESDFDRANRVAAEAAKDLDCEFEECKPEPPKVIVKEKIVVKEKKVPVFVIKERVIIKEIPVTNKNITQCNRRVQAGTSKVDARQIALGKKSGSFIFDYETYREEDRLTIVKENEIIFDSGCVGTNGVKRIRVPFSGNQDFITVQVIPNCVNKQSTATQWKYLVNCPE